MEKVIPNCSSCGTQLTEKTTKNGRVIYACPNWLPNMKGCKGDIYDPNRAQEHQEKYPRILIRWNVASRSEKGKYRTVEVYESGNMSCNCIASEMGKFCRHQQIVVQELKNLLEKIKKENAL